MYGIACGQGRLGLLYRVRTGLSLRAVGLAAFGMIGCGGGLPRPAYAPQPTGALVQVPVLPPPGRIEAVPPRPSGAPVWLDGEWGWRRARWAWTAGRWVDPPARAKFSPWVFVRGAEGTLWYAPGVWRATDGTPAAEPSGRATARVETTEVLNARGESVVVGATRAAGQSAR
jgi:hypothetical protein